MLLLFYLSGFFINHPDHLFNCHSEHFFTVILNETRLIRRASEESYGVLKAKGSFTRLFGGQATLRMTVKNRTKKLSF